MKDQKLRLERYRNEGTWEFEYNGQTYGSPEDVLTAQLPFCGCGEPLEAIKYITGLLGIISKRGDEGFEFGVYWKELEDYLKNDKGVFYFTLYTLDHLKFTEHGGSIGGCWLSEKGREFLLDAKDYIDIYEL